MSLLKLNIFLFKNTVMKTNIMCVCVLYEHICMNGNNTCPCKWKVDKILGLLINHFTLKKSLAEHRVCVFR